MRRPFIAVALSFPRLAGHRGLLEDGVSINAELEPDHRVQAIHRDFAEWTRRCGKAQARSVEDFMNTTIGFIGLGAMGSRMAKQLLAHGYGVRGFDLSMDQLDAFGECGGTRAESIAAILEACDTVCTSLTNSEAFSHAASEYLVPGAREGQVFIDFGTVVPAHLRTIASQISQKGATLLDVPVSGGTAGAAAGTLKLFAGGDERVFAQVFDILNCLAPKEHIIYCGPTGTGQLVKGVNQLCMGLSNAAVLEAVSYGVNAGVDAVTIRRALGSSSGWGSIVNAVCHAIEQNDGDKIGIKIGQYAYFLDEAHAHGVDLPICRSLMQWLKHAPDV